MAAAVKAGVVYAAIVFAVGFALGAVRVLFLAPRLGATMAVMFELPVMLAVSWLACGRVLDRVAVPARWRERLTMGAVAFGVLMLAEALLSWFAGSPPAERTATWAAVMGLAAQVAFGVFPLVRMDRGDVARMPDQAGR